MATKNWPTSLPEQDIWAVVYDVLDGKVDDVERAAYAVYTTSGYAMGKYFGMPSVVSSAATSTPKQLTEQDKLAVKAYVYNKSKGMVAADEVEGPWLGIILTLAPIILDLLSKWRK